jgi:prolyl 4-hydroxylase
MHVTYPLSHIHDPILERRLPFICVIDGLLSLSECEILIRRIDSLGPTAAPVTTHRGFVHRPDIRNNERVIFDDLELAADLYRRIESVLLPEMIDEDRRCVPCGLNERFRGYRYQQGQRFAPHFDGAFRRSARESSTLTALFYLNDGFGGGETAFNDWEIHIDPLPGRVLLFTHHVLHEGKCLEYGQKYVLRSDVMYRARIR